MFCQGGNVVVNQRVTWLGGAGCDWFVIEVVEKILGRRERGGGGGRREKLLTALRLRSGQAPIAKKRPQRAQRTSEEVNHEEHEGSRRESRRRDNLKTQRKRREMIEVGKSQVSVHRTDANLGHRAPVVDWLVRNSECARLWRRRLCQRHATAQESIASTGSRRLPNRSHFMRSRKRSTLT